VEYEPEGVSSDDEHYQTANSRNKGKNSKKQRSGSDNSDIDSDIDESIIVTATAFELLNTDQSYDEADESESDQDEMENEFNGVDLENADKWKCQDCKTPNTPYIRFCSACYKERKGWLPERPKPKHKKNKNNSTTGEQQLEKNNVSKSKRTNGLSVKNSCQIKDEGQNVHEGEGQNIHEGCSKNNEQNSVTSKKFTLDRSLSYTSAGTSSSQDSGFSEPITTEGSTPEIDAHESSDDETLSKIEKTALTKGISISSSTPSMLCTLCCAQPKNACLVHGRISHQVCCYVCALKLYKNTRPCPVCRRRIEKITKNIIA
jgi:E3 ubiquitin-protein ligase Mdm2